MAEKGTLFGYLFIVMTCKFDITATILITEMKYMRNEGHEKNSMIHLDRLRNKCTNYKEIKNNTNFGQITGMQEQLDTTCK